MGGGGGSTIHPAAAKNEEHDTAVHIYRHGRAAHGRLHAPGCWLLYEWAEWKCVGPAVAHARGKRGTVGRTY
jgi:hypothetical protein